MSGQDLSDLIARYYREHGLRWLIAGLIESLEDLSATIEEDPVTEESLDMAVENLNKVLNG